MGGENLSLRVWPRKEKVELEWRHFCHKIPRDCLVLSAKISIVSGVAGRYAVALFELAEEQSLISAVEADLSILTTLLDECVEFNTLVSNPTLGQKDQWKALQAVAGKLSVNPLTVNFLGVLNTNRRLDYLAAIISDFAKLCANYRGEVSAEVISAAPLSEGQINALAETLRSISGQDVLFETRVDDGLLGGLVVKMGSKVVDSSLRTKLESLKISMKGI